jgi:hypothetical protein
LEHAKSLTDLNAFSLETIVAPTWYNIYDIWAQIPCDPIIGQIRYYQWQQL